MLRMKKLVEQHQEAAQKASLQVAAAHRERDSASTRLAQAEMTSQLLRTQLDAAGEERRRVESARAGLEGQVEELRRELRSAHAGMQHGLQHQQMHAVDTRQSFNMSSDLHTLRSRLAEAEKQRDRDRSGLAHYQSALARLQGQLVAQQSAAATQLKEQLKARTHESEIAFSVELLTFANKF
ncbi:MAG: hypothetical protein SGPRY_004602 [Prymnesium sp.]